MPRTVRVIATDETIALGLAGKEGWVGGWTTPSVTNVSFIGDQGDDHALGVYLDGHEEALWFHPDLIEEVGL